MKIVVSEKTLRRRIKEVMSSPMGAGWQSTGDLSTSPVEVSAVVDPSAAVTDPGNDSFVPRNRMELKTVISSMIDDISDDDAVDFYSMFKDAVETNKEKEEKEMTKSGNKAVEETIRRVIRNILSEAGPYRDTGMSYSGPMSDSPRIPAGMKKCQECNGQGVLYSDYGNKEEKCPACNGAGRVKGRTNVTAAQLGDESEVYDAIAQAAGYGSAAGARGREKRTLEDLELTMDERLWLVKDVDDYIKHLASSGELDPEEIKLLKNNIMIVADLDGFKEFQKKRPRRHR